MNYLKKSFEFLSVKQDGGVIVLTFENADDMNAVNLSMIEDLGEIFPQVAADPSAKVLVLTGSGRAFSAGGNMRAMAAEQAHSAGGPLTRPLWNVPNISAEERLRNQQTTGLRFMRQLFELEIPTIAALNGPAAGAGMDTALWCDIRIMAESAFMVNSYVRVGLVPFDGSMWLLPRMVGLGRALEIMYSGRKLDAAECERIGLANRVVKDEDLMTETMAMAHKLADGPGVAYSLIKHITQKSLSMDHVEALDLSYTTRDTVFSTADHAEGVRAFYEHRAPKFIGR